jgi:phosphatidyl-myo-inositol dimannoside synthase
MPAAVNESEARAFRERIGAGSRPILLSVGRLTRRKGIAEFVDHALPRIVGQCPDALLVIIGHEPSQALSGASGVTREIQEIAAARNLTANVALLGRVDDATLWAAYTASQVFVFPVIEQAGDVEGFGMVAVEAAAYGLATVAFATGGVVDAVQEGVSGFLAEPGNYQELARLILAHLRASHPRVTAQSCTDFATRFSWDLFGQRLREICGSVISLSNRLRPGLQGSPQRAW